MSERLDPEEVKGIMDRIFGEIAKVVNRYEGCLDKFMGDAVMALFGTPKFESSPSLTYPTSCIRVVKLYTYPV
jgi:class 3 adenylate cyclase